MNVDGVVNESSNGGRHHDPHVARPESSILPHDRTGHAVIYMGAGRLRSSAATGPLVRTNSVSLGKESF